MIHDEIIRVDSAIGPGKLLMIGVRNFADLRPKNRQICLRFLRI